MASDIVKYVVVTYWLLQALLMVNRVGKPREPMTASYAMTGVAECACLIALVLIFWES